MNRGWGLLRVLGLTGLVLGGMVFGAGVASVATAPLAMAQTANQVVVQGNRRVEADTIRSYFRPGRIDAASIDEALKALYGTGLFEDVRIVPQGGRVVVTVVENSVINRVAFEGNKKLKDEQLSGEVQSKPRGTLSRPVVQSDTQRIVETYRRNGRFDVRVEPKIIDLPNNRVDLVFEINEGEKTSVKSINFVGNSAFSATRLRDEIRTSQTFLPGFLSFLQSSDIYDADRLEADRDLLRRFYLKKGYADVRIVSAVGEYDPARQGFIVTFTIDEGQRYRFGAVDVQSSVPAVDSGVIRSGVKTGAGDVYNAEAVEKTVENLSIEVARRGYPFAVVRPRGDRNPETGRIDIVYTVEEGARIYIERINVRGNTRTRDYVIRREFDVAEGDAYNRALVDRAERRLKNLNYFKSVKITNEPGSAPDRTVLNVDVEEIPTGEFSVAGGFSTADGFMGEVSVGERNLLGRGQYARASVQYGQRARGFELSFAEPFFLGYRLALGTDLYMKQTLASSYYSYDNKMIGTGLRAGFALSEEISFQARYSIYRQEIGLPGNLANCSAVAGAANYVAGCPSVPVRRELANGGSIVSLVGYTLAYNTLDNNKNPTSGILAEFKQDFAGVGGDVNFVRSTADLRSYYELFSDVVTVFRLQGGHLAGWGSKDLRMLDHFQMGPNLVRGFATAGIGPRDLTANSTQDALGGTMYWGASVEAQTPFSFLPKDVGIKGAVFADAGSLWNYRGPTTYGAESVLLADSNAIRASVGAGLIWNSPFGPLRFDYSVPLMKQGYDRVQQFRFGGGTRF